MRTGRLGPRTGRIPDDGRGRARIGDHILADLVRSGLMAIRAWLATHIPAVMRETEIETRTAAANRYTLRDRMPWSLGSPH